MAFPYDPVASIVFHAFFVGTMLFLLSYSRNECSPLVAGAGSADDGGIVYGSGAGG